jgi:hypothetical protein
VASGPDGHTPPPPGDTQEYDSIALQLLRGRGFEIDYGDPEWRRPYIQYNDEGIYDDILSRPQKRQVATRRAPMLPLALAATYRVFGRSFLAWRVIQSVCTAFALTLVCAVAWRAFGSHVALISAGLMLVSASYPRYIADLALMTEPLAAFGIAVLLWSLSLLEPRPRYRPAALCGVAIAFLCLTRSFYIVWTPFVAVLVWWIARRSGEERRRTIALAAVCLAIAVAVQIPWWIRNCLVTGAFMPFGTQAGVEMHTAFSDLALKHRGIWWWARLPAQYERAYVNEIGTCAGCDEVALARYGMRGARVWVMRHPLELPKLTWWKISFTWMLMDETGVIGPMFWLVLASPFVLWRRRHVIDSAIAVAILVMAILSIAVVALTWTVGWRFLVPSEPLLTLLVAVCVTAIVFGDSAIAREDFA